MVVPRWARVEAAPGGKGTVGDEVAQKGGGLWRWRQEWGNGG